MPLGARRYLAGSKPRAPDSASIGAPARARRSTERRHRPVRCLSRVLQVEVANGRNASVMFCAATVDRNLTCSTSWKRRRQRDGELCGHVEQRRGQWYALTVFGAVLGRHDRRPDAADQVLTEGLAFLAERSTVRRGDSGEEAVVCIQEANAASVTVARGYYSMPGVPTLTITAAQIASGEWEMYR